MARLTIGLLAVALGLLFVPAITFAQQEEGPKVEGPQIEDPKDLRKLSPESDVWLDLKNKQVVTAGRVSQREALLEMFACPAGTKEHESILAIKSRAMIVHAALLATGAEPGKPASWDPKTKEYHSAKGPVIKVELEWLDAEGKKKRARGQEWVRNIKTKEEMKHDWVFAGSGHWVDPRTKRKHYLAESGSLICVSNFPDAMMDLPIESSQSNEELLFTPFTERIPPQGTRVLVYLKPVVDDKEKKDDAKADAEEKPEPAKESDESKAADETTDSEELE